MHFVRLKTFPMLAYLSVCLALAIGSADNVASADLTIATAVSVDGLTATANGNIPPPVFPITYTTFLQDGKARVECADGSIYILDTAADSVYQIDPKTSTYRVESIKKLEDFTNAFQARLAKRLTIAEDLNFFPAAQSATYLGTSTSKTSVTGGAHFVVERPAPRQQGDQTFHGTGHHRGGGDDGGGDGIPGGGGMPGGGGYPGDGGGEGGGPGGTLPFASDPNDDGDPDNPATPNGTESPSGGDNPDGDNSPDGGDGSNGDGSGSGGPGGQNGDDAGPVFMKSAVPDFYISGAIWQSPTAKLPKDKHGNSLPFVLQMVWAGGPFVADLVKQLDQSRELPLHSEFSIKEEYPNPSAAESILLNCTIKTTFDVQSISTSPLPPNLFIVPVSYTKSSEPFIMPQVAAPYVDREQPILTSSGTP
jgi:hypothetical protein